MNVHVNFPRRGRVIKSRESVFMLHSNLQISKTKSILFLNAGRVESASRAPFIAILDLFAHALLTQIMNKNAPNNVIKLTIFILLVT